MSCDESVIPASTIHVPYVPISIVSQSPTGSPSSKDILLVLSAFVPPNLTYLDRTSIDDLVSVSILYSTSGAYHASPFLLQFRAISDVETNSQILKVKPLGSKEAAPLRSWNGSSRGSESTEWDDGQDRIGSVPNNGNVHW
jgi:hypothetical protein